MLILARLHRSSHNKSLHWKILCSYGFLGLDFDTVTVVGRSKPTLSGEQESRHFDFGWAELRHFGSLPTVPKRLTLSRVGSHTMKLSDRSSFQFLPFPVTLFRYAFTALYFSSCIAPLIFIRRLKVFARLPAVSALVLNVPQYLTTLIAYSIFRFSFQCVRSEPHSNLESVWTN